MVDFSFTVPLEVRVSDLNYGGHVSNARVLDFFQEGRVAYLAAVGPYTEIDIGGAGLILPEAHVQYRAEMFAGDALRIGVKTQELRNSSFVLAYRIERDGKVVAEGTTALVAFDYQRRKPVRLPEAFRASLANFEGLK